MKTSIKYFLLKILILFSCSAYTQIGIGTAQPDKSSALDISSKSRGLLMPRLSTVERDDIALPATGLMIYNHTSNDGQLNTGTPEAPKWIGIKGQENSASMIHSLTSGDEIITESTVFVLVPGMTISPPAGTYLVLFNGQISSKQTFSSDQGVIDVKAIYRDLKDYPGGQPHGLTFGTGETLLSGIYDVTGAPSIAGTLTMDGGGDPNAVFIIRGDGAFTTGANTTVVLTNGANANNIYWLSEVAMSTGASTIMKGKLISKAGAIALGANTDLSGGMYSIAGALTMGANTTIALPAGTSAVDFGTLSSFVMFTASGAISGCPDCSITGDVGTADGIPTDFGGLNGNVYGPGTTSNPNVSTYAIWKDGVEVPFSSRTIVVNPQVSLQALVTVEAEEDIEVRWKVTAGGATLYHRVFSLIPSL